MGSFGSANFTGSSTVCFVPRATGLMAVFGGRPEPDYDASNLLVFWGVNPMNTFRFCSYAAYDGFDKIVDRARERGAMIVVVDPVRSEMAQQAHDWIDLKLGTDAALGLAMLNVIVEEELYDKEFAEKWIVGFDKFQEQIRPMTPEWAEPITGLPAARIADFARLYATTKPALIHEGNGLEDSYPLMGTTRKPGVYVHSRFRNLPMFQKMQPHPMVRIHPDDAEKRGIRERAWVTIKNQRGEMQALAKLSFDTKPGLVVIDFGWGNPWDKRGGSLNKLTGDDLVDPLSGGPPVRMFVCEVVPSS